MSKLILLLGVATIWTGTAVAKPDHDGLRPHDASVCPPGLAKHNSACLPPGRYRKLFEIGQRVPYNFQGITHYEGLPLNVRHRYAAALDPRSRYIFDQGIVYRIDPETMIVSQILQTIQR